MSESNFSFLSGWIVGVMVGFVWLIRMLKPGVKLYLYLSWTHIVKTCNFIVFIALEHFKICAVPTGSLRRTDPCNYTITRTTTRGEKAETFVHLSNFIWPPIQTHASSVSSDPPQLPEKQNQKMRHMRGGRGWRKIFDQIPNLLLSAVSCQSHGPNITRCLR